MTGLVVVAALRSEYAALVGRVPGAVVERCGMGPDRVRSWLPRLAELQPDALVVAGVAGGLDPSLRPGDVVVASEVRDEHGRIVLRAASPLVAELRRMGMRVHTGPMVSCDKIVGGAEREKLARTGALAVDMESAALVRALGSDADRPPVAVVRVIVDTAHMPLARLSTVASGARALLALRQLAPALRRWADLAGPRRVVLAAPLFVDELDEVPDGTTVVFSAHGVAPAVREEAARRKLTVVDATCPLVAKVHTEARRFIARGDTVLLIGHDGHDETEGTLGEGQIQLVQSSDEAERVVAADPAKVAVLTQTTLALDDANEVVDALRRRFPLLEQPPTEDICYATTNRQDAVRAIASESDLVLVVGSQNSSNSLRLVEVAERAGVRAHLVDDAGGILPEWIENARTIGITAGASAPPHLVDEVIGTLRALGPVEVDERVVTYEDIKFTLPKEVAD